MAFLSNEQKLAKAVLFLFYRCNDCIIGKKNVDGIVHLSSAQFARDKKSQTQQDSVGSAWYEKIFSRDHFTIVSGKER